MTCPLIRWNIEASSYSWWELSFLSKVVCERIENQVQFNYSISEFYTFNYCLLPCSRMGIQHRLEGLNGMLKGKVIFSLLSSILAYKRTVLFIEL